MTADRGRFAQPLPDGLAAAKVEALIESWEKDLADRERVTALRARAANGDERAKREVGELDLAAEIISLRRSLSDRSTMLRAAADILARLEGGLATYASAPERKRSLNEVRALVAEERLYWQHFKTSQLLECLAFDEIDGMARLEDEQLKRNPAAVRQVKRRRPAPGEAEPEKHALTVAWVDRLRDVTARVGPTGADAERGRHVAWTVYAADQIAELAELLAVPAGRLAEAIVSVAADGLSNPGKAAFEVLAAVGSESARTIERRCAAFKSRWPSRRDV